MVIEAKMQRDKIMAEAEEACKKMEVAEETCKKKMEVQHDKIKAERLIAWLRTTKCS